MPFLFHSLPKCLLTVPPFSLGHATSNQLTMVLYKISTLLTVLPVWDKGIAHLFMFTSMFRSHISSLIKTVSVVSRFNRWLVCRKTYTALSMCLLNCQSLGCTHISPSSITTKNVSRTWLEMAVISREWLHYESLWSSRFLKVDILSCQFSCEFICWALLQSRFTTTLK